MNSEITPKYSSGTSALFVRLAETILSFRWLLLILVAVLTIFAFYEMRTIKMDNSNEAWFVKGDRTVELLDKFRDVFGNDDFVILLFESENFFELENIRVIGRLAKALEAEVPYLKDITWLGNVEYIEGTEDGINIYELLETIPKTSEEMAQVQKKALNEDSYINSLIAPDGKAYTIVLEMDKYGNSPKDQGNTCKTAIYRS
jgi:predicted RND superfamily exporter protein